MNNELSKTNQTQPVVSKVEPSNPILPAASFGGLARHSVWRVYPPPAGSEGKKILLYTALPSNCQCSWVGFAE